MNESTVMLPNGTPFDFWDDVTAYTRVYHVARQHPRATDDGPGSADQPFATIGRAAELLEPGEKVVVHEGVYRECVRPARGGSGPNAMIAYEGAPGEMPAEWFIGYNPFIARNFSSEYNTFVKDWTQPVRLAHPGLSPCSLTCFCRAVERSVR